MKDDIVIVSAARTPVGAFNGVFGAVAAHELGKVAVGESLKRAGVEKSEVSDASLGGQSALRLGTACGRARLSGDTQRRFRDRRCRRPGIHEPSAPLCASA